MNVVPDTNLMISGFLWRGAPRDVMHLATSRRINFCGTKATYKEFCRVISYAKFANKLISLHFSLQRLTLDYLTIVSIFPKPQQFDQPIVKEDPDDDIFVYAAMASRASIIVSGDKHLLGMKEVEGVHVLNAYEFMKLSSLLERKRETLPLRFPKHPRLIRSTAQ